MKYKFEIHRRLPSLNDYIHRINHNRYAGNKFKQDIQESICWEIKSQLKCLKIDKPVIINIIWIEENRRRDVDNVYSAVKYIQDALVEMQVIKNDNSKNVIDVKHRIEYAKESKVKVELIEVGQKDKQIYCKICKRELATKYGVCDKCYEKVNEDVR